MNPRAPFFKRFNWVNIAFLSGTPIATVALLPGYLHSHGLSPWNILLFVVCSVMSSLSITAGYHRYFAHRSYSAKPVVKFLYLLFGSAAFQGSALQWSADHRRHHRFVDTEKDPHNIKRGFFYAHMGWLCLNEPPADGKVFPPDLARDPMIAFQDKYYVPIAILAGFGFPTLAGDSGKRNGGLYLRRASPGSGYQPFHVFHKFTGPHLGQRSLTGSNRARQRGDGVSCLRRGLSQFPPRLRGGLSQRYPVVSLGTREMGNPVDVLFRLDVSSEKHLSAQILKARLQMEQRTLELKGAPSEYLAPFKLKVEEAQRRVRQLREDYHRMKQGMEERSRLRLELMKLEGA